MKDQLEIERVFLLQRMPELPPGSECLDITQGYFEPGSTQGQGRLRRTACPNGTVICHANVKHGTGRVRHERESIIDISEFEHDWPATSGRRIRKHRHRVAANGLVWEIDEFLDLPLVLAEIELPAIDHEVTFPPWLALVLVREVSDDPRYHNYALALHGIPPEGAGR